MATYNTTNTDFTGGLMSPHLRGRIDIDKFTKGLQQMENFLPSIQGPTRYRQGMKWVRNEASGNVRLIDFTINNQSRFLISLSAGLINVYNTAGSLLYSRGGGVDVDGTPVAADDGHGNAVTVPYLDDQIMDVRYSREVETMIFTHPLHPPYELTANTVYDVVSLEDSASNPLEDVAFTPLYASSPGSEGLWPWTFRLVTFTSHPFQKIDTSDTVLRISNEVERIRLKSSNSSEWVSAAVPGVYADQAALVAANIYTEYKVGNQWSLGKITEYISGGEIIVDPVESVVNIEDASVRLVMIEGNIAAAPWTDADGVDNGTFHVRADTLIFRTSHIGSWVRVGGDRLFTNVCDAAASPTYASQDGFSRWGKIIDYRGIEDHPVDFIEGTYDPIKFDSGSVYEIYDWGVTIVGLRGFDGTGTSSTNDLSFACRKSGGTWRFAMNHDIYTYTSIWHGEALGGTVTGAKVANMSTQRQFDVVEVDSTQILVGGTNLITPTGDVTAYDLVTDPRPFEAGYVEGVDTVATHTATVTASKLFFDAVRDNGRYLLGNLVDRWVLMQIDGSGTSPYSASVNVLNSIPRDDLTDDLKNNGVFTQFRMGAWYEDNYPACVSYYEQRRVFAGTRSHPNLVWLSNLNDPTDFRTSEEDGLVLDSTGITYQLGTGSTIISWLEAGPTLIVGTESNEWQLRPNEFSAAITPSNIRITQETSVGSRLQGRRIGGSVFFPHISGKQLHEFKFDFQTQQFVIETVTKLVPDLFENDPIRSMSYQFNPNSTIWIVTETGNLFSLTYRKEDDYYAWAKHSSNGTFKDVVVVPKGDTSNSEDQVWFVVERSGQNELEIMANSFTDTGVDDLRVNAAFLDSYVRTPATGSLETPATTFSAPERCIVDGFIRLVVDGVDLGSVSATIGINTIPDSITASDHILVGLPYTGRVQPNPQAFDASGKNAYGQTKRVVSMRPYLYKSMGYKIGFSEDALEQIEPAGGLALFTGFTEEHTILDSNFDVDETPIIIQDKAYPLTIVSAVIKTDLH